MLSGEGISSLWSKLGEDDLSEDVTLLVTQNQMNGFFIINEPTL